MRLEGRPDLFGKDIGPIDHRGDPRLRRSQQADQGGGVDVLFCVVRPEAGRRVGPAGRVSQPAEQRLPHVAMGVDEVSHS